MESTRSSNADGAYGFRIHGVVAPPSHLVQAPAHWPPIELSVRVMPSPPLAEEYVGVDRASLQVRSGGSVVMDRAAGTATFLLPSQPSVSALLHPHLAGVAAVWSHWCGYDGFHAGGFVAGGGVWGVLGDKGSGKSSTLAALARAGIPIVCDDVLVLGGGMAFAGPRSIDLRTDAARELGAGQPLGVIGERERWRVALGSIQPELPFRGWIALSWGPAASVRPMRGSERMRPLVEQRALRVPPRTPSALIDLADRPFLEFSRPRHWGSMKDALGLLLDAVAA